MESDATRAAISTGRFARWSLASGVLVFDGAEKLRLGEVASAAFVMLPL